MNKKTPEDKAPDINIEEELEGVTGGAVTVPLYSIPKVIKDSADQITGSTPDK